MVALLCYHRSQHDPNVAPPPLENGFKDKKKGRRNLRRPQLCSQEEHRERATHRAARNLDQ
jgi:hypothetical protein